MDRHLSHGQGPWLRWHRDPQRADNSFAPTAQPFLPNRRERTRVQLERMGLEIPCFSSNCELSDEGLREDNINEVTSYIELASDMGTPSCACCSRDIHPTGEVDDDGHRGRAASWATSPPSTT